MYVKEKFTKTAYYHIVVGSSIIIISLLSLFSQFFIGTLIVALIYTLIGAATIYAGYQAFRANRSAILYLILFNALQIILFHLDPVSYRFVLGPYIHLDLIQGSFTFGIGCEFQAGINSFSGSEKYFSVSFIPILFLIYLLDQIRFIPRPKDMPWETEFTTSNIGKVVSKGDTEEVQTGH